LYDVGRQVEASGCLCVQQGQADMVSYAKITSVCGSHGRLKINRVALEPSVALSLRSIVVARGFHA